MKSEVMIYIGGSYYGRSAIYQETESSYTRGVTTSGYTIVTGYKVVDVVVRSAFIF
jgi:hypothetical protein